MQYLLLKEPNLIASLLKSQILGICQLCRYYFRYTLPYSASEVKSHRFIFHRNVEHLALLPCNQISDFRFNNSCCREARKFRASIAFRIIEWLVTAYFVTIVHPTATLALVIAERIASACNRQIL